MDAFFSVICRDVSFDAGRRDVQFFRANRLPFRRALALPRGGGATQTFPFSPFLFFFHEYAHRLVSRGLVGLGHEHIPKDADFTAVRQRLTEYFSRDEAESLARYLHRSLGWRAEVEAVPLPVPYEAKSHRHPNTGLSRSFCRLDTRPDYDLEFNSCGYVDVAPFSCPLNGLAFAAEPPPIELDIKDSLVGVGFFVLCIGVAAFCAKSNLKSFNELSVGNLMILFLSIVLADLAIPTFRLALSSTLPAVSRRSPVFKMSFNIYDIPTIDPPLKRERNVCDRISNAVIVTALLVFGALLPGTALEVLRAGIFGSPAGVSAVVAIAGILLLAALWLVTTKVEGLRRFSPPAEARTPRPRRALAWSVFWRTWVLCVGSILLGGAAVQVWQLWDAPPARVLPRLRSLVPPQMENDSDGSAIGLLFGSAVAGIAGLVLCAFALLGDGDAPARPDRRVNRDEPPA